MSNLLKEFPLGVTTSAFIYGVVARDHVWLIGFIWSIISVLANRGMKRLSMLATDKWPETKPYLNRPDTENPGMPSGQAQIAASFVVFLAIWLWYFKRAAVPAGAPTYGYLWLTIISLLGFLAMERAYLDKEQTRLQIVVGAIIGGIFGLVPYYSMLKMPWKQGTWNIPATWSEFIWIIFVPAIIFLVGSYTHELLISGGFEQSHNNYDLTSSLATEYPESLTDEH